MKKIASLSVLGLMACVGVLEAGTVRLVNDSPYKLRAVVRANDGTFLGEVVINPQNTSTWTDGFAGLPGGLNETRTQTPYTILWYCLEGDAFSTVAPVATGATATAMMGDGARQCRPQKQRTPQAEVPPPPMPLPGQGVPMQ